MMKLHRQILLFFFIFAPQLHAGTLSIKANKTSNTPGQINFANNRDARGRKLYMDDEVVVRFRKNFTSVASSQMIQQYASRKVFSFGKNKRTHLVRVKLGQSVHQALARFKSDPNVATANLNYMAYALQVPNDAHYGNMWGLKNTMQVFNGVTGTSGSDIKAEAAWDILTDCSSITVAVLDTGINYTHQDLAANINTVDMYDFVDNDATPYPNAAQESHGTHVAGTIGAIGDNTIGTTGICWKVKILPIRVLDKNGDGTFARIAAGIEHAVTKGAKVINMSLGGNFTTTDMSNALDTALASDVVVVVAAGNDGTDNDSMATPLYPCNHTHANIICVTAMDNTFTIASFSNTGSSSVDVGAPGVYVYSTTPGAIIRDTMTGWTKAGSWVEGSCKITGSALDAASGTLTNLLLNPSNYCDAGATYSNSANDVSFKSFDLSGLQFATLNFSAFHDLEATDLLRLAYKTTGTDPFVSGSTIGNVTDSSPSSGLSSTGYFAAINSSCLITTCSLGFKLESINTGTMGTGKGVGIVDLYFETVTNSAQANAYEYFQGTSMASPHVAGVVALVRAYNPDFTYSDTVNAIKNGGTTNTSLGGKTTTGKTVDAQGALHYVNTPANVTATIQ